MERNIGGSIKNNAGRRRCNHLLHKFPTTTFVDNMSEEEAYEPKKKVLIANCSGFIGRNLSKRFAADGFEVLGTVRESEPKPLAVSRVVDSTPEALVAAFLESELTVLDCLGDMQMSETILAAVSQAGQLETPKVLVGVSSVMTWARTSPDADEPEKPLTEGEYKRRRPHGNYKELVSLEKLVTKCKREGLRTHVVRTNGTSRRMVLSARELCSSAVCTNGAHLALWLTARTAGCRRTLVRRGGGPLPPALQVCVEQLIASIALHE